LGGYSYGWKKDSFSHFSFKHTTLKSREHILLKISKYFVNNNNNNNNNNNTAKESRKMNLVEKVTEKKRRRTIR
jgi:hypothetical protein